MCIYIAANIPIRHLHLVKGHAYTLSIAKCSLLHKLSESQWKHNPMELRQASRFITIIFNILYWETSKNVICLNFDTESQISTTSFPSHNIPILTHSSLRVVDPSQNLSGHFLLFHNSSVYCTAIVIAHLIESTETVETLNTQIPLSH